jgi:hypothetical protein
LSAAVYGCCGLHPHYLVSLGGKRFAQFRADVWPAESFLHIGQGGGHLIFFPV